MLFCEHAFVTSQGSPGTRFQRSIQARNVFLAETAAFEMGSLSLEDALQLVVLYAEAEDDKFDKARREVAGRLLLERPMTLAVVAHSVRARQSVARAWGRVVCWGA